MAPKVPRQKPVLATLIAEAMALARGYCTMIESTLILVYQASPSGKEQ